MRDDLPADLAYPRSDRASLIANIVVGGVLLLLTLGMIAYVAVEGGLS